MNAAGDSRNQLRQRGESDRLISFRTACPAKIRALITERP